MAILQELLARIGDVDKMLDEIRRDLRKVLDPPMPIGSPHFELKDPSGVVGSASIADAAGIVHGMSGPPVFFEFADVVPVLRLLFKTFPTVRLYHVHSVTETKRVVVAWIGSGAVKELKS